MNKKFYIGSLAVTLVFSLLTGVASISSGSDGTKALFIFALILFGVTYVVIFFLVIHKMWSAIQDEHARMDSAKAIVFLLIPFFNIYWMYQVWKGFREDYNSYIERYDLQIPSLDSDLYHIVPTLMILSVLPLIGPILGLINLIAFMVLVSNTCDAINNLNEVKSPQTDRLNSDANYRQGNILNI